jgi:hypothetical protein
MSYCRVPQASALGNIEKTTDLIAVDEKQPLIPDVSRTHPLLQQD